MGNRPADTVSLDDWQKLQEVILHAAPAAVEVGLQPEQAPGRLPAVALEEAYAGAGRDDMLMPAPQHTGPAADMGLELSYGEPEL